MFGVTPQGFLKPTDTEIDELLVDSFKTEFGNEIILTPQVFLGQQLAILKKRLIEHWDYAENVYYSRYISTSTGVNLDRSAFPFVRLTAIKATTILRFIGDDLAFIVSGSIAETAEGVQFVTTEDGTIEDSSGGTSSIDINAVAINTGESGNQAIDSITELPITITGIDSVTNPIASTGGEEIENDSNFEARSRIESQQSKSSSIDAVRLAVISLDDVINVTATENTTDFTVDGIPPRAIQIVVNGSATNKSIATAIYLSKPAGGATIGNESYTVVRGSNSYLIRFSRSLIVNINVDLLITVNNSWESVDESLLKLRVLEYIGGVDNSGNEFSGLNAGVDVLKWKIQACLFNLENRDELGIVDITAELSKSDDPSSSENVNIEILPAEEALTDLSIINIYTTVI